MKQAGAEPRQFPLKPGITFENDVCLQRQPSLVVVFWHKNAPHHHHLIYWQGCHYVLCFLRFVFICKNVVLGCVHAKRFSRLGKSFLPIFGAGSQSEFRYLILSPHSIPTQYQTAGLVSPPAPNIGNKFLFLIAKAARYECSFCKTKVHIFLTNVL